MKQDILTKEVQEKICNFLDALAEEYGINYTYVDMIVGKESNNGDKVERMSVKNFEDIRILESMKQILDEAKRDVPRKSATGTVSFTVKIPK